ncbi:MAG TPA: Gfo/Idh/MocA family oxidoreductase [Candidatus Acidoferrum sp.]|nr:Gfo/Idh/MocA family oxidoreductase [Candidatus Acidoferrum sp.]
MDSRSNIAVVGCGYWGKNLVRNFHKLGNLKVICDVSDASLSALASQYGVETCKSYQDVLARPDINAVAIATPAAQHHAMVRAALLAGKDVFVEKPLALQLAEGEEIVEIARQRQRVLMVGHLLYYHPAIRELKELIRKGTLGRVEYVYSSRLNFGKLRTEENILWSFAPHDISAILYLLDEDPVTVAAHGGAYLNPQIADLTLTSFKFASGVTSHIFVSWLHPFKEQKLVVVGDQKMAVFDDTEPERKLVLYPHRVDWIDRLPVAHKSEGEVMPLPAEEPLLSECSHFVECVATRKTPRTDGNNGVRVLRVLNASEQSLKQNGQVQRLDAMRAKYFVHPTAFVDDPCEVGDGTHIWHFTHVMPGCTIGKNCNLGQNVHVASGVRIGNNVKIQNNVSVYAGVELENDVFCGPSMVFTNVINPRSHVNRKNEYQRTLVRKGASLGANSTIVCGTTIGEYAFVGAGAVVTKDVADYALVVGTPARRIGWMCSCGVRLSLADGHGHCASCGKSYLLDGEQLIALSDVPLTASSGKSTLSQLHAPSR